MEQACPGVIEKELNLRKSELKKMTSIINRISKKMPLWINLYSTDIKNYLKNPNDKYIDSYFLKSLLPAKSPALFNTPFNFDKNCPIWIINSKYCLTIGEYDFNKSSYQDFNEFSDELGKLCAFIEEQIKGSFKCFHSIQIDGGKDDGVFMIILKPSDEFINIAKSYGWHE